MVWQPTKVPRRLVLITRSNSSTGMSITGVARVSAALFTSTCRLPKRSIVASSACVKSCG
ncbi:hypothetical protein D3C75_1021700 [compost metagenome]